MWRARVRPPVQGAVATAQRPCGYRRAGSSWPAGGTRARWPAGALAREPGSRIRFGARCDAAWTRIWQTRVGDRVEITAPGISPNGPPSPTSSTPGGTTSRRWSRHDSSRHCMPASCPRPVTRASASRLRASLSGWRRVPRGRHG
ncbi:DUF2690 domain-containing protein [Streptomyces chartreusis]|uniref:DUF2690 domain-containing protein n=1 Tax=Streptomyces chartreusis TaxID=1969 RepID=UPI00365A2168